MGTKKVLNICIAAYVLDHRFLEIGVLEKASSMKMIKPTNLISCMKKVISC
jgi:hypothetical protein